MTGQPATRDLQTYFGLVGRPPFTGSRFEALAGGGDADPVRDRITAEDLIAVETLSVQVPIVVALDLLEGDLGDRISTNLKEIGTGVRIGTDDSRHLLRHGGPAEKAWKMLKSSDRVGWVIAGKLLARKRPSLIPVYDNVVRCAYGRPKHVWLELDDRFRDDAARLPHALMAAGQAAGIPAAVQPLRILDIVVWMRHRATHRATGCSGLLELRT